MLTPPPEPTADVQVLCRENCETVPDSGTGYEMVRKALPKVFPDTQHRCAASPPCCCPARARLPSYCLTRILHLEFDPAEPVA